MLDRRADVSASKRALVHGMKDTVAWRIKCRRMSAHDINRYCDEDAAARVLQGSWRRHQDRRLRVRCAGPEVINDVEPFTQEAIEDVSGAMFDVMVTEGKVVRYHAESLFQYLHQSQRLQEPVQRHVLTEEDVRRLEATLSNAAASDHERALLQSRGTLLAYLGEEAQKESELNNQLHNELVAVFRDDLNQCLHILVTLLRIRHADFEAHVRHIPLGFAYDLRGMRDTEEALDHLMMHFRTTCMHFCMWSRDEAAEAMRQKMKDIGHGFSVMTSHIVVSMLAVMERWIAACEYAGASPLNSSQGVPTAEDGSRGEPEAAADMAMSNDREERCYRIPPDVMVNFPCIPGMLVVESRPPEDSEPHITLPPRASHC